MSAVTAPQNVPTGWSQAWFIGWLRDYLWPLLSEPKEGFVDLRDFRGLDLKGNHDCSSLVRRAHLEAAADALLVRAPITPRNGGILLGTQVDMAASMHGQGGNGYKEGFARTRFIPGMTDGTAALRALSLQGFDFRRFAVESAVSSPNPNPSGGNVQQCFGIQLGKAPALIVGAAKTTIDGTPSTTNVTLETAYLNSYEAGDVVTFDNIGGMGNLNFGMTPRFTINAINRLARKFTVTTADNSGWGAYTADTGIVYPNRLGYGLGAEWACSRGVLEDVTVVGCAVNFHLAGWLNRFSGIKSFNGTLGLDGGYLNSESLDYIAEQCWQAFQLLGCNDLDIERLEDEGAGTGNDQGAASTIDYSTGVRCRNYSGEGARSTATPWMKWGSRSACKDIRFSGTCEEGGSGGVSIAIDRVNRPKLPVCKGGFSTTANTTLMQGTVTMSGTSEAVAFASDQEDAEYRVILTAREDPGGRIWADSHAVDGFTVHCSASSTAEIDWQVIRP